MGFFGDIWPLAVIGLFNGAIYGLAAMGVVLTYKTSGIFNFAYGAVAMFCAFTFWQLRDGWGLNQWVALPILVLVVAPLIGLILERLFRPVAALSAEIQIVISLGVLAFLQALALLIWGGSPRVLTSIFSTTAFDFTSKLRLSYTQVFTLFVAAALGAGLWALLRHTRLGVATQAVVDNRDLAELNGISSDTVSRTAWVISTMFAAVVGVLLSGQSRLDVYSLVLVVIFAFAPAVVGRLISLPLAFAGALALGVGQSIVTHWGSSGTLANLYASVPYLALFALLLLYGNRLKELRAAFQPVTSAPAAQPASRRKLLTMGTAGLGLAVVLPALVNEARLGNVTSGVVFASIALTLVVLTGWTGQISLAQFTFVGVGAFTVGHLAATDGSGFFWAAAVGALIAIPIGLLVGLPSLRLSGLYLALATMAFALTVDTMVFSQRRISGGTTGMSIPKPRIFGFSFASTTRFYYLAVAVLAVFAVGALVFQRGPIGRRLQMIRDAPLAASTFGVNLTLTKLAVFALSGAGAAFAGAMFGALRGSVSPGDFGFGASLGLLLLVVLGGRALVGGALIAGFVYMLQILPGLAPYLRYIQLGIAVGVVYVAQYPDGPLTVAADQSRRYADLLRSFRQLVSRPVESKVPEATSG
ncbi:MAG: ABC transporter permease [Actinobacteria bacterium]|nr:ABC transporter permease [Actinomycetota bacterium]